MPLTVKRICAAPAPEDGCRILVDRLWPRGIKRDAARLDEWNKAVAPSTALRQDFHRGGLDFAAFSARYGMELDQNPAAAELARFCRKQLARGSVTLLYAAKNESENHALVLKRWLERALQLTDPAQIT